MPGGKKKIIKEDAKAKKKAKARQKAEAKKRKKNDTNKVKIDLTFGIKNKKGSKNRRFVRNANANMNQEEIRKKKERQQKKREKEMLLRMKREEEALFKTVDNDPQFKKKSKKNQLNEQEEEKIEIDDETLLNNCAPDELDELIDRLREKFADRTDLTPVNEKTFVEWLDKKTAEKAAQREAKAKKKLQKKGKKGLTGRELFLVTPNVFKDDENATDKIIFEKEEKKEGIAVVDDVCDASLFLDMDGMDDMFDDIDKDRQMMFIMKEYVYKSIDMNSMNIICLDEEFNDIVFDLDEGNKDVLDKVCMVIDSGVKEKKDVKIIVSGRKKGDDEIWTVTDAKFG
eukprot:434522_1